MNKNALISGIIFGLIFLALGGFLLTLRGESTLILVIAVADLLFGTALLVGGLVSSGKKKSAGMEPEYDSRRSTGRGGRAPARRDSKSFPDDAFSSDDRRSDDRRSDDRRSDSRRSDSRIDDMPAREEYRTAPNAAQQDQFDDLEPETPDFASMSPEEIQAEEERLREDVHRSSAEARAAIDEAKAAVAQANADEQALARAEEESRRLTGAAQQNALRDIDRLAQQATASSNKAAAAKQKARAARDEARRVAELHSKAVEAAAGSMEDDF